MILGIEGCAVQKSTTQDTTTVTVTDIARVTKRIVTRVAIRGFGVGGPRSGVVFYYRGPLFSQATT